MWAWLYLAAFCPGEALRFRDRGGAIGGTFERERGFVSDNDQNFENDPDIPEGPMLLPLDGWHRAQGGRMVEFASAESIYDSPRMPYTRALLSAAPGIERATGRKRIVLRGDVPSPLDPPSGCPFRTRCWLAEDVCAAEPPPLQPPLNY